MVAPMPARARCLIARCMLPCGRFFFVQPFIDCSHSSPGGTGICLLRRGNPRVAFGPTLLANYPHRIRRQTLNDGRATGESLPASLRRAYPPLRDVIALTQRYRVTSVGKQRDTDLTPIARRRRSRDGVTDGLSVGRSAGRAVASLEVGMATVPHPAGRCESHN